MEAAEEFLLVEHEAISTYLRCPICTNLFTSPLRLHCGHSFCQSCIGTWMERENTCPECRERFNMKTSHRDRLIEGVISDMKAKCKYRGCSWEGKFGNWQEHCQRCNFHPDHIEKWMQQAMAENKNCGILQRLYEKNPKAAQQVLTAMAEPPYEGWAPFTFDENNTPDKRFKADRT